MTAREAILILLLGVAGFSFGYCTGVGLPRDCRPEADTQPETPDPSPRPLPIDPAMRCAVKALRGDYGELAEWQERGYIAAISCGVDWRRAWATQYYPSEGFPRGQACSTGYPVDERVAAANELPAYAWVWSNTTGLRQVLDCGARRNDRVARRKGADLWIDFWVPRAGEWGWETKIIDVAVIQPRD